MEGIKDVLFEFLKKQSEVIIYGCGNNGRFLQWILQQYNLPTSYWCDSKKSLWNTKINNVECISPEQLAEHREAVVIIGIAQYKEVLEKLDLYKLKKILTWDDVRFLQETLCNAPDLASKYRQVLLGQSSDLAIKLKSNNRFKDIHKGQKCFIIGNGPSVRQQNLSLLNEQITFTVNQMARSDQFKEINTQYHLWADSSFFKTELNCEGDYKLLEIMKRLPKQVECFFPYNSAKEYVEKFGLDSDINVNYYADNAFVNEKEEIDFTGFIRVGYTVVQYAIRLALYMGFKEIYLLGCECTTIMNVINARLSSYTSVTHCYEIDDKEKERAKNMYFSLPMQEYYKSELGVLEEYRLLREYCEDRGVKLRNCTPGGLLEEIPRENYEDVVAGISSRSCIE